ncbi:MAG: class I SAM-dependent methyltransferase [Desulfosarcinaceae bacterium]|nr:class I SAM-dependent methyltransferase [Desulfosarcinaceae bacterium]
MHTIDQESIVDLVLQLKWRSDIATHTETYAANAVNMWRDYLPGALHSSLLGRQSGDRFSLDFKPGDLLNGSARGDQLNLARRQFDSDRLTDCDPSPRLGRFYPRGLLKDVPGVFSQNMQPFRCTGVQNGSLQASFDHPLRHAELTLNVSVGSVQEKEYERGGSSASWIERLTEGPGMQARWQNKPTDFYAAEPFRRADEAADPQFYRVPRLVDHIDQTAQEMLSNLYLRFVDDDKRVLDLMSSWHSHLPAGIHPRQMTGIGLNAEELRRNPLLTERIVQDLNEQPFLPHADGSFDLALCALSVEYLVDPVRIFQEVARVLAPNGVFVVSFSNRWFPPKAIQIWSCLHEFERMGLVLEYFQTSGRFDALGTYSMRGLPRPRNDKYALEQPYADPIYAVWGAKREGAHG